LTLAIIWKCKFRHDVRPKHTWSFDNQNCYRVTVHIRRSSDFQRTKPPTQTYLIDITRNTFYKNTDRKCCIFSSYSSSKYKCAFEILTCTSRVREIRLQQYLFIANTKRSVRVLFCTELFCGLLFLLVRPCCLCRSYVRTRRNKTLEYANSIYFPRRKNNKRLAFGTYKYEQYDLLHWNNVENVPGVNGIRNGFPSLLGNSTNSMRLVLSVAICVL